jgi:hypothetical protein
MKNIQNEIANDLLWAATGYARAGLALSRGTKGFYRNPQVAIGNLGIAIELLLKALIAKRSLLLLFKDLPLELRCALASPEAMPKTFRSTPYEIELKASAFKSIELDEAIAIFCTFYPDFKKRFSSHLRFLSRHRNICVHAVHPNCREYEVDRTVFLFLSLIEHMRRENPDLVKILFLGEDDKNKIFLAKFDEERLNRVHEKVEKARTNAKQITERVSIKPEEWSWYPIPCPVCGSDGILSGETTAKPDYDEDGPCGIILSFTGEIFECEYCGLVLDDYEEMSIAGIDPEVDRSDESDQWQKDHYSDNIYDEPW